MNTLIDKIKQTGLFDEEVKKEVISELSTYNEDEMDQLESALDDYEASMKSVLQKHKLEMSKLLENPNLPAELATQIKDITKDIDSYVNS